MNKIKRALNGNYVEPRALQPFEELVEGCEQCKTNNVICVIDGWDKSGIVPRNTTLYCPCCKNEISGFTLHFPSYDKVKGKVIKMIEKVKGD